MIRSKSLHTYLILFWCFITPPLLRAQQPFVAFATSDFLRSQGASDTIYWYPNATLYLPVVAGPAGAGLSVRGGTLSPVDKSSGRYIIAVDQVEPGKSDVCVTVTDGGSTAEACVPVVIEQPALEGGIDHWKGMGMTVGRKYNPSSEWENIHIPQAHYQTVVEADGKVVLDRSGTRFRDADLPSSMLYRETTRDLKATVYWKPAGTEDRGRWVALVASYSSWPSYLIPEHGQGFNFNWLIGPKSMKKEFGPIVLKQEIDEKKYVGVNAQARCQQCEAYGLASQLIQVDDTLWTLVVSADPIKTKPTINGKRLDININMTGRGGASGYGVVTVTIEFEERRREETGRNRIKQQQDFYPDNEVIELIRGKRELRNRHLLIYEIEGEIKQMIMRLSESDDIGDANSIESICQSMYKEPFADCFSTISRLVSSARTDHGHNFNAFKQEFVNVYGIDSNEVSDEDLHKLLGTIMAVLNRRASRPDRFYLVATDGAVPKPMALVAVKSDTVANHPVVLFHSMITGSDIRQALDGVLPGVADKLLALLSKEGDKDARWQEIDLVKIWPKEKPKQ